MMLTWNLLSLPVSVHAYYLGLPIEPNDTLCLESLTECSEESTFLIANLGLHLGLDCVERMSNTDAGESI